MFFILLTLILVQKPYITTCLQNNACRSYNSYLNIYFSDDCYDIPDNGNDVREIVQRHVGAVETHHLTTSQGYIVTLFRIPRQAPKGVILFQHGMFQDSRTWVAQYNQSVAFLFWHSGYDIWLSNNRGTRFSKRHVNRSCDQEEFWDFSVEEMGFYDMNDVIEYIKAAANVNKIIYVGHSLGTTLGLVYASLRPKEAQNSVQIMVLVSPVVSHRLVHTPVAYLFSVFGYFFSYNFHKVFKWYSSPTDDSLLFTAIRTFNRYFPFKYLSVCLISVFCGWSPNEFDENYVNLMADQFGSATPLKAFSYFNQMAKPNSNFTMYDYGAEGNLKKYGNETSPPFPLDEIKVPVFTICGEKDVFCSTEDIKLLYSKLNPAVRTDGHMEVKGFNHLDYLWGKRRNELVYSEILKVLSCYTAQSP